MKTTRAVLHSHPSFYSPHESREKTIEESLYTFFSPVPDLLTLVEHKFRNNLGVSVISACHTPTGGMDLRFKEYMKQRGMLDEGFLHDYDDKTGTLKVRRKTPIEREPEQIVIPYSQEVRTRFEGRSADINIIGTSNEIEFDRDIDETIKRARDLGCYVSVCHPNSSICSSGIEKAISLLQDGKIHAIEAHNANEGMGTNLRLARDLDLRNIPLGPAVPDSHYYSQDTLAFIVVDSNLIGNYSPNELKRVVQGGFYQNVCGQSGFSDSFVYHRLPILMGIPRNFFENPEGLKRFFGKSENRKV